MKCSGGMKNNFKRKEFIRTAHQLPLQDVQSKKKEEKCLRTCSYVSLVPLFVMLLIVVTISLPFTGREKILIKNPKATKCHIQLVESIPDGLNYSIGEPQFMSTYDAWNTLLDAAHTSLYMGTFYWTMRGVDVINHTTAAPGEAIFARLLENGLNKNLRIRIAQSIPTEMEPNFDTKLLVEHGAADVRSVDFPRLIGDGVLHTKLWIVDKEHFYLGSANMDWRSLTQVKELGVLGQNCAGLTADVAKIFQAYWFLGSNTSKLPNQWPKDYATKFNQQKPMMVDFNQQFRMSAYFSSSPPQLIPGTGRTHDVDAIVSSILSAQQFVHVAVMDYFPLLIYTKKIQYWPYIDDALRKAAVENKVSVKLLISWWKHSRPSEDYFLRSLLSLTGSIEGVDIEIKRFIVPADADQQKIPFGRVNHNKYMVTDNIAYIGTSNWSGDYFTNTAGIGLVLKETDMKPDKIDDDDNDDDTLTEDDKKPTNIRDDLSKLFLRDWNSPYAVPLKYN